jgi:RNA polymerase sigma factor (sigma-70 family)
MYTKYDNWSEKPDKWLAEAIFRASQDGNEEERNIAFNILFERHWLRLVNAAAKRLEGDFHLAEDTVQQALCDFEIRVSAEGLLGEKVENLLNRITRNKTIDAFRNKLRKQKSEYFCENDIVPDVNDINTEELVAEEEELHQIAATLPFITSYLSDCERVVWILRHVLKLPRNAVARLLGKTPQCISTTLNNATAAWKMYKQGEDYTIHRAYKEIDNSRQRISKYRVEGPIIEQFSKPLKLRLTDYEIEYARHGMFYDDEFTSKYNPLLILPWTLRERVLIPPKEAYLMAGKNHHLGSKRLFSIDYHGDNILLKNECYINIATESAHYSPNGLLAMHGTSSMVPVILRIDENFACRHNEYSKWLSYGASMRDAIRIMKHW